MSNSRVHRILFFLQSKVGDSEGWRRILINSGWLFGDTIIRLGIGMLVGVWVARYLGPEQFGLFSYAITIVTIFGILAKLGLDSIVVVQVIRSPNDRDQILGSTFLMCIVSALLAGIAAFYTAHMLRPEDTMLQLLVAIMATGLLFQPFHSITLWFRSQLLEKYTVLAKGAAFLVASLINVSLILLSASLLAFAATITLELALAAASLVIAYKKTNERIMRWHFNLKRAKTLLSTGWPLIFSSMFVILNMQIDKIMLGELVDIKAVGYYAVAVRLSEVWYFIPVIIGTSVTPALVRLRKRSRIEYTERLQQVFSLLTWLGLVGSLFIMATSEFIIRLLYSETYLPAASVLSVHIWSAIFVFHVSLRSNSLVIEDRAAYITYFAFITLVLNVWLNFLLIPEFDGVGAAYASLLSWSTSVLIAPWLAKGTRKYPFMFFKSIVLPWKMWRITAKCMEN